MPLEYSVLKPETNSDSPSAKSKGVRLVSARVVINQQSRSGGMRKAGEIEFLCLRRLKESDMVIIRGVNKIRVMDTS